MIQLKHWTTQFVISPMIFNIKVFLSLKRREYFFKMYLVMIDVIANHYNSHRRGHIRYAKCGLAHAVQTPHAVRHGYNLSSSLRSYFFRAFFLARKKGPKKVLIILRCKIFPQNRESLIKRNGIVTSFALFLLRQLLEMRCRLRRCTYTSQNEALAPQTVCGLLTYTVLKALVYATAVRESSNPL